MTEIKTLKDIATKINDEEAFFILFYNIISHTNEYDNIVEYSSKTENGIDGVIKDIAAAYRQTYYRASINPYEFCDIVNSMAGFGNGEPILELLKKSEEDAKKALRNLATPIIADAAKDDLCNTGYYGKFVGKDVYIGQ